MSIEIPGELGCGFAEPQIIDGELLAFLREKAAFSFTSGELAHRFRPHAGEVPSALDRLVAAGEVKFEMGHYGVPRAPVEYCPTCGKPFSASAGAVRDRRETCG